MRQQIWAFVVGLFAIGSITLAGCGTKPEPEKTEAPVKTELSSANTSITTSTPEEVKLVHEMDPTRHTLTGGPVRAGFGGPALATEASIENDNLIFRTKTSPSEPEREIRLKVGSLTDPKSFDNKKLTIRPEMSPAPEVPEILIHVPNHKDEFRLFPNGYALTLELGSRVNWKIPGKIYLCLPDAEKTVLAGFFIAEFPRQPVEPPGPEDLPYIKGSVTVLGAPPTSLLRVGYFVDERPGVLHLGSADLTLSDLMSSVGLLRNDSDQPRITYLLAGDGKTATARYEHSKLTTGRYLVFARLTSGPIAWKWLAVLPGETQTVDLTIDATQTGGIEIVVPLEAVKEVEMVPADKPGYHALEPLMFAACSLHVGLVQPIVAQKAVFKNLAPGRYEVRAAGQSRTVEIIAGKIIELDFDKPFTVPEKPEPAPEPRAKQ